MKFAKYKKSRCLAIFLVIVLALVARQYCKRIEQFHYDALSLESRTRLPHLIGHDQALKETLSASLEWMEKQSHKDMHLKAYEKRFRENDWKLYLERMNVESTRCQ